MAAVVESGLMLRVSTPAAWFDRARTDWRVLLIDHANCEKKAASTALSLIFTYAEDAVLCDRLSKLAREELRHFEQVQELMRQMDVSFARLPPARYAQGLRRAVRTHEPGRLLDLLACGAIVEARSYERFAGLAECLPGRIAALYEQLKESEARHYMLYVELGEQRAPGSREEFAAVLNRFADLEAALVTEPDAQFRFHSGLPV